MAQELDHLAGGCFRLHDERVGSGHRDEVGHAWQASALHRDRAVALTGNEEPRDGFTLRVPAMIPSSKVGAGSRLGRLSGPVPSCCAVGPSANRTSFESVTRSASSLP